MSTIDSIRPPTTADPAALRQWGFVLVNSLRRVLEEEIGAAQNAVNEIIGVTGATLTNFDDLSDAEKLSLGLSDAVNDQLAIDDVISVLQEYASSAGRAAIFAQLRDYQNQSAIRVQQTVSDGLASQITTISTDVGATSAAIAAEITARSDGDTALAADITTVSSTVAGHTATLTTYGASIDGIEAEWGVAINLQGQVTGLIRLDADATESTFTAVVDKFQIAKIDGTGIVPVFQVGTVGGVSRVALAGDMLVDGSIVAQNIAAGTITGAKIAAGTITADKITASTLSAITANVGTVTAGKLQRADGTMVIDLDNKIISITT